MDLNKLIKSPYLSKGRHELEHTPAYRLPVDRVVRAGRQHKGWMINVFNSSLGPVMSCIICGDIPDSLKIMNKPVVFSGELKDACGIVDAQDVNRFYIVSPTAIN